MELIPAKTMLSGYTESNNWFGNNYNMNIYKGCSHGCIYCDSRSECYRVEDFDRVRAKANALTLLERDLKSKRRTGVIGTGAMSDPYNPLEKEHELTREALKLIYKYRFGVSIATKSDLVARDVDLLSNIAKHAPVLIKITVTTSEDLLCQKIEPNVASPTKRFAALKTLTDAGIFAGTLLMPVLPFIEDTQENIQAILANALSSGARFIYPAFGVTLRLNQRDHFYKMLDLHFPGIKQKYIEQFGDAYSCHSPHAKTLMSLLKQTCQANNIPYRMPDIITAYKAPYVTNTQLSLFD